jgi:hypothetical protein
MKRSTALAPLSRDHQRALDVALRLRLAAASTIDDAVERFAAFFDHEGNEHFAIEEECLVPELLPDDPEWTAAIERVAGDHVVIREGAAAA